MNGLIKAKKLFSAYEVKNLRYQLEFTHGNKFIVTARQHPLQSEEITLGVSNYTDNFPSKRFSADIEHLALKNTTDFFINQPHGNERSIKDNFQWLLNRLIPNFHYFMITYSLYRLDTNERFYVRGDCYYKWASDKAQLEVECLRTHKLKTFTFPNDWWSQTICALKRWSIEQTLMF